MVYHAGDRVIILRRSSSLGIVADPPYSYENGNTYVRVRDNDQRPGEEPIGKWFESSLKKTMVVRHEIIWLSDLERS